MLYIIGGPPRSGKSVLRKHLLETYKIAGISLDVLVEMLHKSMPELDINMSIERKVLNVRLWPFLEAFINAKRKSPEDFVLEGEFFSPDKIAVYKNDPLVKICFTLYPSIDIDAKIKHIRDYAKQKDWYNSLTDEAFKPHVQEWHERSHAFKGQCEARGLQFFDTSSNFEDVVREAGQWMVER